MRKNAGIFAALALVGAAVGLCLRVVEVNTLLDRSSMLMDFSPLSVILMVLMAAFAAGFVLLAKRWELPRFPQKYGPVFRGVGMVTVSVVCCAALLLGAYLSLRRWQDSGRIFGAVLALPAVLSGFGWLNLSLDAQRNKPNGCTLLAAAMPVIFCALLLIGYYKNCAPIPALRYTMYPFLALCADLLGVHYLAGFTAPRLRPKTALTFAGIGFVLSIAALPSVDELEIRIFLAVFAVQLFAHGLRLLLPQEFVEADFAKAAVEAPDVETSEVEAPEAAPVQPTSDGAAAENPEAPEA